MLIQLNIPKNESEKLRRLTHLISAAINFCHHSNACKRRPRIDYGEFEKYIIESKFDNDLLDCYLYKSEKLEEMLASFFAIMSEEDESNISLLLKSLESDIHFHKDDRPTNFSFHYTSDQWKSKEGSNDNNTKLNDLFEKRYKTHFDKTEDTVSNRERYKSEYKRANPKHVHICPACLGPMTLRTAQFDHYFPKSKYPALAVHPYNLVPICSDCNSSSGKGERVPTSPLEGKNPKNHNKEGCLNQVFIPYILSGSEKFKVKLEYENKSPQVEFGVLKGKSEYAEHIRNHVNTYQLEKVWRDRIPEIDSDLLVMLERHFKESYRDGNVPTIDELKAFLWRNIIWGSDERVYERANEFLFVNYAIYRFENPNRLLALHRDLIKTLEDSYGEKESFPPLPHFYEPDTLGSR